MVALSASGEQGGQLVRGLAGGCGGDDPPELALVAQGGALGATTGQGGADAVHRTLRTRSTSSPQARDDVGRRRRIRPSTRSLSGCTVAVRTATPRSRA